jgi:hypothetical protein
MALHLPLDYRATIGQCQGEMKEARMTEQTKPKTIFAAIPRAMGAMKRIAKDNKNTEQKYDFASVDDFLAMTGPILAENGLFIHMDESSIENFERQGKYGVTHWARYTFIITVMHESGESLPAAHRSVEVIRSGAQAAGSAQSYVLKQFQRALFNIPTGDKDDPDFAEKADGAPIVSAKEQPNPQSVPQVPSLEAIERAKASLLAANSLDALRTAFMALPNAVKAHPEVMDAKDVRKIELESAPPADDLGGDTIRY